MKKNLFFSVLLLILATTACNNNNDKDKDKEKKTDTTKVNAFTNPDASDPQATIKNKLIYKKLDSTTKKVGYIYDDFMAAIKAWDDATGTTATDIYMVYAAYTMNDMDWYLTTHKAVTKKIFLDSILNQPCLLMGYPDPANAGKLFYKEFGTICPPPTSCETHAMIPNKMSFFKAKKNSENYPGFDPDAMIDNYVKTYDTDADHPLTSTVKFNIDSIRNLYKAAGIKKNESIYFFLGAYDNQDAQRYVKSHAGYNIAIGEIQDRTCLLFALFDPGTSTYSYFDFGTICPPESSCKSNFK